MRAYAIHRPIGPFTWPSQHRDKVTELVNYDEYRMVDEIGRRAFGHIDFSEDIPSEDLEAYELVVAKEPDPVFEMCVRGLVRVVNNDGNVERFVEIAESKYGIDDIDALFEEAGRYL